LTGEVRKPDDDKSAILDAALALAKTQLSAQVADDASLDGRTTGLVGLNGALVAAVVAAQDVLGPIWWAPVLVLAGSTLLMLRTLFGVDRKGPDLSVRAAVFYENQGAEKSIPARELLLAELNKAFGFNVDRLMRKRERLQHALVALLTGLTLAGLLIAFDRPTTMESCPKPQDQDRANRCNSQSRGFRTLGPPAVSPRYASPPWRHSRR
jgi:hypothetical protein